METALHAQLKHAGVTALLASGCCAAAREVRCPISQYRVDVAGYLDPAPSKIARSPDSQRPGDPQSPKPAQAPLQLPMGAAARTVFIEAKASRADLFRDAGQPALLADRHQRLVARLDEVQEEFCKPLEPELCDQQSSLFECLASWRFHDSRLHTRGLLADAVRRAELNLLDRTKFATLSRYRLASWLYLLTPAGLIQPHEVPVGWGLLERTDDGVLLTTLPAPLLDSPDRRVLRVLRNIAAAACRSEF